MGPAHWPSGWRRITAAGASLRALAAAGLLAFAAVAAAEDAEAGLKDAAQPYFTLGAGIDHGTAERPAEWPLLTRHFALATPENCMKPAAVQPVEGEFRFQDADRFVAWARSLELSVVGHCLVWAKDDRTPAWFFVDGGQPASPDLLRARLRTHIETVVTRYRGAIPEWDVVNEALADGEGGFLRESGWTQILGEEFLVDAFQAAHAADPHARLIYNDYNCDNDEKRDKLQRLAERLQERGAPVHAIGLQGHYELDAVPFQGLEDLLKGLQPLGLKVVISELDIDVIPRSRWWADNGAHREELARLDPYREECPAEILQRQADQYAALFALFRKYDDVIERVTFWNLHDGRSWLNGFPWRRVNHPLLFDRNLAAKPAFHAVLAELQRPTQE